MASEASRLRRTDAALSGRKIGLKIETDEPDAQLARDIADRGSFRLVGKYRVDDDGMTLRKNANGVLFESPS